MYLKAGVTDGLAGFNTLFMQQYHSKPTPYLKQHTFHQLKMDSNIHYTAKAHLKYDTNKDQCMHTHTTHYTHVEAIQNNHEYR